MMPAANQPGGFTFGQAPTGQPANKGLFGTTTTTTTAAGSGGFTFGANPAQPVPNQLTMSMVPLPLTTAAGTTGIGFGTGTTSGGGFTLGQPAATSAPSSGFSFTATQPAAAGTTTSAFSFGTTPASTTTAAGGFTLGGSTLTPASTAASTGFTFGATTTTAPATGLIAPTTTTSTSGFSFGLGTATTTTAPTLGFSTGTTLGGQATKAPLFGGFGTTTTVAATSIAAPTSSIGLGGIGMGLGGAQPPSASTDANSSGSKLSGKSTKDQQLSPDLFATIAVFESRKNAENSASEENIRQTAAPFHKIGEKAKEIQKVLAELASDHLQLQANTSNLKGEVMKEAEHVEMAKRTKDTPMALQGDNKAPEAFFINLVRSFEAEMMYCRTKIEEVSQCMQAASNPCETEEDIAEVLQREHDTLKDLAAKVYAKHSQLVELSHLLKTKTAPNEQEFFRPHAKEDTKAPASSVVRPVLGGGGSGLLAFQEQQQRAKAVTLGAAPPTMPLAHTTTPSMFSGGSNTSGLFTGSTGFGSTGFGSGTTFGTKPLFGNTSTNFGSTATPGGLQQTGTASPFAISSPFNAKPFGTEEDDGDSRRKRRL